MPRALASCTGVAAVRRRRCDRPRRDCRAAAEMAPIRWKSWPACTSTPRPASISTRRSGSVRLDTSTAPSKTSTCVSPCGIHLDAELGAAHRDRRRRAVHPVRIRLAGEVIDLDAHDAERDFEELAQRAGRAIILEHHDGFGRDHHHAAVAEIDHDVAAAARIDAVAGGEDVAGGQRQRRQPGDVRSTAWPVTLAARATTDVDWACDEKRCRQRGRTRATRAGHPRGKPHFRYSHAISMRLSVDSSSASISASPSGSTAPCN